jgi:hypothetical protein
VDLKFELRCKGLNAPASYGEPKGALGGKQDCMHPLLGALLAAPCMEEQPCKNTLRSAARCRVGAEVVQRLIQFASPVRHNGSYAPRCEGRCEAPLHLQHAPPSAQREVQLSAMWSASFPSALLGHRCTGAEGAQSSPTHSLTYDTCTGKRNSPPQPKHGDGVRQSPRSHLTLLQLADVDEGANSRDNPAELSAA